MRIRPIPAALGLMLAAGCSQASEAPSRSPKPVAEKGTPTPQAMPIAADSGSRVLAKHDFMLRGEPACRIDFAYAGHEPEDLFWEEPCAAVTVKMVTQADLAALGKWDRLDAFARKFVAALPGGRVLYVEGSFSASIYPIGTTGSTYEVSVAD